LSVKHSGEDASEAARVCVTISNVEDGVEVPETEKANDIKKSGVHFVGCEAGIFWIFSGGMITMCNDQQKRKKECEECVDDNPGHALVKGGPVNAKVGLVLAGLDVHKGTATTDRFDRVHNR
jgi:hypothetical protein